MLESTHPRGLGTLLSSTNAKSDSVLRLFFDFLDKSTGFLCQQVELLTQSRLSELRQPLWGWGGIGATQENDAVTTNSKGYLSVCPRQPLECTRMCAHTHTRQGYACVHFLQGLRSGQASHSTWMNSRSVLPAVCSLPPKESRRDSDSRAWSSPRSRLAAAVRVKAGA